MVDVEVDAIDFKPEEDDLMDDDMTMDDGNAESVPTSAPKLKSNTGGTSWIDDGSPHKTKRRGFIKETDAEHNSRFASRE